MGWNDAKVSILAFLFVLVSFLIVAYSGYLGGKLVYEHHLGVGRNEATGHPYLRERNRAMSATDSRNVKSGKRQPATRR